MNYCAYCFIIVLTCPNPDKIAPNPDPGQMAPNPDCPGQTRTSGNPRAEAFRGSAFIFVFILIAMF